VRPVYQAIRWPLFQLHGQVREAPYLSNSPCFNSEFRPGGPSACRNGMSSLGVMGATSHGVMGATSHRHLEHHLHALPALKALRTGEKINMGRGSTSEKSHDAPGPPKWKLVGPTSWKLLAQKRFCFLVFFFSFVGRLDARGDGGSKIVSVLSTDTSVKQVARGKGCDAPERARYADGAFPRLVACPCLVE